jgi:hypothetical protein
MDWAQLSKLLPLTEGIVHFPNAVLNENSAMDNIAKSNNYTNSETVTTIRMKAKVTCHLRAGFSLG